MVVLKFTGMTHPRMLELIHGPTTELIRFMQANMARDFLDTHVGDMEDVRGRFRKCELADLCKKYWWELQVALMHSTIVVRVCDEATFGVVKDLVLMREGDGQRGQVFVADQAAKDAIRLTDMTIDCEERRIFADDETVGRAHYSHGGIVYTEYLEAGIVADSIICMG